MNLNTGEEWSEMDDRDLRQATTFANDTAEIADFLCRDVEEVRASPSTRTAATGTA